MPVSTPIDVRVEWYFLYRPIRVGLAAHAWAHICSFHMSVGVAKTLSLGIRNPKSQNRVHLKLILTISDTAHKFI